MNSSKHQSRRTFLKYTGITSVGFLGLQNFLASCSNSKKKKELLEQSAAASFGYGDLIPDPLGIINLPKGFSYEIISRQGDPMTDGFFSPDKPDGMGCFAGKDGNIILVRNHEINPDTDKGPFGASNELLSKIDKNKVYDYGFGKLPALGGTSTLIYHEPSQKVVKSYLSLSGTSRNCAGGMTPWGSWITCEETVYLKGDDAEQDHGYNFDVPASETINLAAPVPLKAMGRFNHEAVAVDPKTKIVYQTEDRHDGLIYRFLPNEPGQLAKGGILQVLAIKGQKSCDTRNWLTLIDTPNFPKNQEFEVEWLDINNVEAPEDDLRLRGFEMGAARFARGEGMWFGDNEVYFACTNGGKNMKGQVFRYTPSPYEGQAEEKNAAGKLELFAEPNDVDIVQNCDNVTIAPWGDIIMCEDTSEPFVVGITPKGEFYKLAHNVGHSSEFTGGVFSPSGDTFFVNIQHAGLTVAIQGPWRNRA